MKKGTRPVRPKPAPKPPVVIPDSVSDEVNAILSETPKPVSKITGGHLIAFVLGCVVGFAGHHVPKLIPSIPSIVKKAPVPGSFVVVVEETGERTPAMAKLLASKYWDGLEARQLKYRPFDQDSKDGQKYKAVLLTKGAKVPGLLVIGPDGKILSARSIDAAKENAETIDATVKEATSL